MKTLQKLSLLLLLVGTTQVLAKEETPVHLKSLASASLKNVSYGEHERNVMDFWKAPSDKPTPLVLIIHGGGWRNGHKAKGLKEEKVKVYINAGISVVAINYRYLVDSKDFTPAVKGPMYDCARALQFIRSKANEWNIDKNRIAATGGSAGGCSSLWLAFHDDLADPNNADPVLRESTRLYCAAVKRAQTTLDPKLMQQWTPNSNYGGKAFRIWSFRDFLKKREKLLTHINEYSPMYHLSSDDPEVYLFYDLAPAIGEKQKDPTHTANFGLKLKEKCDEIGVKCELVYPGASNIKHASIEAYLINTLKPAKLIL